MDSNSRGTMPFARMEIRPLRYPETEIDMANLNERDDEFDNHVLR